MRRDVLDVPGDRDDGDVRAGAPVGASSLHVGAQGCT